FPFSFQAADGIRDFHVTGVQTCALPIFPKNRETRAPLVLELLPHKDELDPKHRYLLAAPTHDPDGRPAVIRFSRKNKEQYVQSEVDGKPTGWRAFHADGKWKVEDKR